MDTEQLGIFVEAISNLGDDAKMAVMAYIICWSVTELCTVLATAGCIFGVVVAVVKTIKFAVNSCGASDRIRIAAGKNSTSDGSWREADIEHVCQILKDNRNTR